MQLSLSLVTKSYKGGRMKRWVQMKNVPRGNLTIFEENQLPGTIKQTDNNLADSNVVQWQAWLRHTRDYPPTIEELIQDEKRKSIVKERARALEQEWEQRKLQLQQEAEKEKQLLEESSRKEKDKSEEPKSTEPVGQGDTFTPGEWNPTVSKR
ncbi:hypothetical protein RMATCC62417_07443 [Rhizopus microsporus]|nr:hypothetical protein RMATCC62417_07443 [Rhizopus microsporus]